MLDDRNECHSLIQRLAEQSQKAWFERYTFVRDGRHLLPHGYVLGPFVARLGPSNLWMPADEPYKDKKDEPAIRLGAHINPALKIFHYGFIRKMSAFYPKWKNNTMMKWGKIDPRIKDYEPTLSEEWYMCSKWHHLIEDYKDGYHPAVAIPWLKERGRI